MIHDLDRCIERLLRDRVPLRDAAVTFDAPSDAFVGRLSRAALTVNLFLYEIHENHELRGATPPNGRIGGFARRVDQQDAHFDVCYAITTWSPADPPDVLAEHALLGAILSTLQAHPVLPAHFLVGALADQPIPPPLFVAQPGDRPQSVDFWSALRQPPRPALHLVATVAVPPARIAAHSEPPRVASRTITLGSIEPSALVVQIDPPLVADRPTGSPVALLHVAQAAATALSADCFGSATVGRVGLRQAPRPGDWLLLDGAQAELVRLSAVRAIAEHVFEITLSHPVTLAHDPATGSVAVRAVAAPSSDPDPIIAATTSSVEAGASILAVDDAGGIASGDVLLLQDAEFTEMVRVVSVDTSASSPRINTERPLRSAHPAGVNVYRRLVEQGNTGADLLSPLGLRVDRLPVSSAAALTPGLAILGIGANEELIELAAPAGPNAFALMRPIRGNHVDGTPIRSASADPTQGRLTSAAGCGASILETALDAPVHSGDLLLVGSPADAIIARALTTRPSLTTLATHSRNTVGGLVTDGAAGGMPLSHALVTLSELSVTAKTDTLGRFRFENLPAGRYTLRVIAPGRAPLTQTISVPTANAGELLLALAP
ncbi:MAG: Pvc16 family protein [Chloroflexota bacterium]